MIKNKLVIILFAIIAGSTLTGFGVGGLGDKLDPDAKKCKGKKCAKNVDPALVEKAVGAVAVGVAAKLIADMVIDYRSKKVQSSQEVADEYIKKNGALPSEAKVVTYSSGIAPGSVVKAGKEITVSTSMKIVSDARMGKLKLEEKIEIFDSEDNAKLLNSLVKDVNKSDNEAGVYNNKFTFKFPVGVPQGVYPIKTTVLIDGKKADARDNAMQIVLHVAPNGTYQLAFAE